MNVAELIEELKYLPQDAEVHFAYNYGDHWRTEVAPRVTDLRTGFVKYSDYHRMHKVADDEDMYDEDTGDLIEGAKEVVIIG